MSRIFAGILGSLAMAVVLCRGTASSSDVEGTLGQASLNLVLFAIVGAILGHIAQATIDESVRAKLEQQLTHHAVRGKAKETAT
jgi:hypothetical protein